MDTYKAIAQNLIHIADYVKRGELALRDIPFESIIEMVQGLYNKKTGKGDMFVELYVTLIVKGIEHDDYEEVVAVLTILSQHMIVFASDEIRLDKISNKNYVLQCRVAYLTNCEKIRKWHEVHAQDDKVPFTGKGVVYSAITGNYDAIKEPKYVNPELDYILFTDNPQITSSVWQVRLVENKERLDNVKLARRIKVLGHEYLPEYDYSIWVDGKLEITENLTEYVENHRRKEPMLCFNHYVNECIYQEADACLSLQKDAPDIIEKQVKRYHEEGYPANNGLIDSGFMVRELKDARVQQVMETWWNEILNGSRRDQLSFNYACWKNDFVYDSSDLFIYKNKYVQIHGHN